MPNPEIKFTGDGAITVCGGGQCVTVSVATGSPSTPVPGRSRRPVPPPTVLPPALSYESVIVSMERGPSEALEAMIERSGAGEAHALHLGVAPGDHVALGALHQLGARSGRTPIVFVRDVDYGGQENLTLEQSDG